MKFRHHSFIDINFDKVLLISIYFSFFCCCYPYYSYSQVNDNLSQKPNIIIILADDLGWDDVGYHGSTINTPNINTLVKEGIELDRFYVQPSCSPTRAALMTGKSPKRLGITRSISKNQKVGLDLSEKLLPQYLNEIGYKSFMVGKWHLGGFITEYTPNARGFEHFYGYLSGGIGYWDHNHGGGHDWQRNGSTIREKGYATTLLGNEAISLINNHNKQQPLLLYVAFGAPHLPNEAPDNQIKNYSHVTDPRRQIHSAMVAELDNQVGRILNALEQNNMDDKTLIFFTSDNGGQISEDPEFWSIAKKIVNVSSIFFDRPFPGKFLEQLASVYMDGGSSNTPLRGGKTSSLEGGVRVPAAIWWPNNFEPRKHEGFMTISDVLPTLLDAVGSKKNIPAEIDGASQLKYLSKQEKQRIPDYLVTGFDNTALYQPPWKLITGNKIALYNIYLDPSESKNLASVYPKRVSAMQKIINRWPTGKERGATISQIIFDMDTWGGEEDRIPWAEAAKKNEEYIKKHAE